MATTIAQNKLIARRFLEDVINNRRFDLAERYVHDNSKDEAQESFVMFLVLAGFPDFRVHIDRMIAEGDRVAVLSTFSGTHTARFMGIDATGKGVLGRKIDTFTITDGKITNVLYNFDLMNLMTQLGSFPEQAVYGPETSSPAVS